MTLGRIVCLIIALTVAPLRAEYRKIELHVNGLDCELCARGVSASIQRMSGVKSVEVSLKKGMLLVTLESGNSFKLGDLRKRVRDSGFRSTNGTVTAIGRFNGSKFEVLGSGEVYEVEVPAGNHTIPTELTFEVR